MSDRSSLDREAHAAAGAPPAFEDPADPDPAWVAANPDRALLFFFVSPRPCRGLETLLAMAPRAG